MRSTEPNRYSAVVLASSVLPVPVGPANRNTPIGRPGSLNPALSMAMRSMTLATASSWPITRLAKNARMAARSRRSLLSRIETGRPVSWDSVLSTSAGVSSASRLSARPAVSRDEQERGARKARSAQILPGGARAPPSAQSGSIVMCSSSRQPAHHRARQRRASRRLDCGSSRDRPRRCCAAPGAAAAGARCRWGSPRSRSPAGRPRWRAGFDPGCWRSGPDGCRCAPSCRRSGMYQMSFL